MLDKSFTIRTINEVLKENIIPHINNSMAKEQAIALISVLKNVDMQTEQNFSAQEQITVLTEQTLNEYIIKIQNDRSNFNTCVDWVNRILIELNEVVEIGDITEKWSRLNDLQCQLIRFLYKENAINNNIEQLYILPLRKKLRKQLNIEMDLVR
ncbi:hypothetical protein [Alkalihalobacterium alkalinitrilicum]|uniref:hypothetical protein n=1 Tax=Alkalihalobacterium alkalinitrilicum TaxID=427920 RepID=UPI00099579B2|nr:hypothetical protein [Alkalihalobacterium alkalinitrilicum]